MRLWDLDLHGNPVGGPFGKEEGARALAFTPDGNRIVSYSENGNLSLWSLAGQRLWNSGITEEPQRWVADSVNGKLAVVRRTAETRHVSFRQEYVKCSESGFTF